ncbi:uncharacterized protein LTHEOB_8388 [Lasiodiplodia theobromae]|nr:uncharacterized protein LTHEOB_8388 [Lasiodiplodia theobromae]KAF4541807.1 hypothetical protein LTHEOB_8388 [Lasiodiplodia theobromae]
MKTYFLPPKPDIAPNTSIKLGSIILSPHLAEEPLSPNPPPIPPHLHQPDHIETDWSWTTSQHRSHNAGIWTSFLQLFLGAGIDVSGEAARSASDAWSAARLTTQRFVPDLAYVRQAVAADEVQEYLGSEGSFRAKKIYMVTGVKIASGAGVESGVEREMGVNFSPGVDGSGVGVPLALGMAVGGSRGFSDVRSSRSVTDFVFAYRLRQIRYKVKGGEEFVTHREFSEGAFYGEEMQDILSGPPTIEFEAEDLEDQDASGEDFEATQVLDVPGDDEGEDCQVAVLLN